MIACVLDHTNPITLFMMFDVTYYLEFQVAITFYY